MFQNLFLQSDHILVYQNKEFIEFCKKNKITKSMSNVGEITENY